MKKSDERQNASRKSPEATRGTKTTEPSRATRKREQTRQKLIDAARIVMAERGVDGTNISDITNQADVGIGSFYNHFPSKWELAETIFLQQADDLAAINSTVFAKEKDPAQAIAFIQKIFLTKAVNDPLWGWFVVHATTDMPQMAKVFAKPAKEHLLQAQAAGRLQVADFDIAVRLILLALTSGMRDLLEGNCQSDLGELIIQSLLQMLGLSCEEARTMSHEPLPDYVGNLFATKTLRS